MSSYTCNAVLRGARADSAHGRLAPWRVIIRVRAEVVRGDGHKNAVRNKCCDSGV